MRNGVIIVDSYDIVSAKVREYWKQTYPHDVIAFFYQKYGFESEMEWEWHSELVSNLEPDDYESVIFENDFCEGQTDVKDVRIVPLDEIIDFYIDNKMKPNAAMLDGMKRGG